MPKKALITGITGQDGSYLADLLLSKGYEVHGIFRQNSSTRQIRLQHLVTDSRPPDAGFFLHHGDLMDRGSLSRILQRVQPDELYHLGAQSHVGISFDIPEYTADVIALGTLRLLDAVCESGIPAKFYNAASSEIFGNAPVFPMAEDTPFRPRSPYACAKLHAYWTTVNYRDSYNLFACNGILFNHESPRRGENFVTRKIVRGLAGIAAGLSDTVHLGNLDAKRDWGYAPDYVEGMWRMLQADRPGDYVLATGETHSVREFTEEAAACFGFEIGWQGEGMQETGIDRKTGKTLIRLDEAHFRPTDITVLQGDASKAKRELGWEPTVMFHDLVRLMCDAEMLSQKPVER